MEFTSDAVVVACRSCMEWYGPVSELVTGLLGKRRNTQPIPLSCPRCKTALVERVDKRKSSKYSPLENCKILDLKPLSGPEAATALLNQVAQGRVSKSTPVLLEEVERRNKRRKPPRAV